MQIHLRKVGAAKFGSPAQVAAKVGVFHKRTGIRPGATYEVQIRLNVGGQASAFSASRTVTTPPAPIRLAPPAKPIITVFEDAMTLNWNSRIDEDSLPPDSVHSAIIEHSVSIKGPFKNIGQTGPGVAMFVVPSDTGIDLTQSGHCFRVRNTLQDGLTASVSPGSPIVCRAKIAIRAAAVTAKAAVAPVVFTQVPVPTSLAVSSFSPSQLKISWVGNPGVSGFRLEKAPSLTGKFVTLVNVNGKSSSRLDAAVAPAKQYCYRLRAYVKRKFSAYSATQCAIFTPVLGQATSPIMPGNLTGVVGIGDGTIGHGSVTLNWSGASTGKIAYTVQAARNAKNGSFKNLKKLGKAAVTALVKNVRTPSPIFFRLMARDGAKRAQYSNVVSLELIPPPAPSDLKAVLAIPEYGMSAVQLDWESNPEAVSGTVIERVIIPEDAPGMRVTKLIKIKAGETSFTDLSAIVPGTYVYRVLDFNPFGKSEFSDATVVNNASDPDGPFVKLPLPLVYDVAQIKTGAADFKPLWRYAVIPDIAVATVLQYSYTQYMISANAEPHFGVAIDIEKSPVKACKATSSAAAFALAKKIQAEAWNVAFTQAAKYINYMKSKYGAITIEEFRAIPKNLGVKLSGKIDPKNLLEIKAPFTTRAGGWFATGLPTENAGGIIPIVGQTLSVEKNDQQVPSHIMYYNIKYFVDRLKQSLQVQGVETVRTLKVFHLGSANVSRWQKGGIAATPVKDLLSQDDFLKYWKKNYCPI